MGFKKMEGISRTIMFVCDFFTWLRFLVFPGTRRELWVSDQGQYLDALAPCLDSPDSGLDALVHELNALQQ